jgi:NAD(P)-dependent dehydrogenase (short-subunit alcohol dehydrogenase family)
MDAVGEKVVLITGAANGIGAEVARQLHEKGARLVLTDVDTEQLATVSRRLGDDRVLAVVADVRDLSAMQAAVDDGVERFGDIDIVVANAGIATYGSVRQVDPLAFTTLIDINVIGVFHTVRAALPSVINRRGYMLIVSSGAAYTTFPGAAPYAASKAAVEHFANTFRLEVAHLGVQVGSAHMSWIDTPLVRDSREDLSMIGDLLDSLPFSGTASVQKCGAAFVRGIERRKRQINCPRWVGLGRWLRPFLSCRVGERWVLKKMPEAMRRLDAEVVALGRSTSARTAALHKPQDRVGCELDHLCPSHIRARWPRHDHRDAVAP